MEALHLHRSAQVSARRDSPGHAGVRPGGLPGLRGRVRGCKPGGTIPRECRAPIPERQGPSRPASGWRYRAKGPSTTGPTPPRPASGWRDRAAGRGVPPRPALGMDPRGGPPNRIPERCLKSHHRKFETRPRHAWRALGVRGLSCGNAGRGVPFAAVLSLSLAGWGERSCRGGSAACASAGTGGVSLWRSGTRT